MTGLVEDFLVARLVKNDYECRRLTPSELLTYNRFDLALKLAYLSYKDVLPDLARDIYYHDIRSQTLGTFEEYGSENKNNFENYLSDFTSTFTSIRDQGFDENKTLVPLDSKGTILNGAHRVASAIYLDKDVFCVDTELAQIKPDFQYFFDRKVPEDILDIAAIKFAEYSKNIYLAFLWPSGRANYDEVECLFGEVVYKKKIKLSMQGALNLLTELYKHMDWVGSQQNGFPCLKQKLLECFTDFKSFSVIMFQSNSFEKVKMLKARVRDVNGVGFSSIHITDTKDEVIRISKLIFNRNGLHFLNYAQPYRFSKVQSLVRKVNENVLNKNKLKDMILCGSMTLGVYGIRVPHDIDYISILKVFSSEDKLIAEHDGQIQYHGLSKDELIYNPKYSFEYLGIKFVSFKQTYAFKMNRADEKDVNDCRIMESLIDKNGGRYYIYKLRQGFFYKKLIFKNFLQAGLVECLHKTNTYDVARAIYLKLKIK